MKIIIFGSTGLVGSALVRTFKNTNYEIFVPKRKEVDLFSNPETKKYISDISPDIIINAAAYTNVDLAESNREEAYLINSKAIEKISEFSYKNQSLFIHYSTDYVFDGKNNNSYL